MSEDVQNDTSYPDGELVGSRTDIGRVRTHNEDSFIVSPPLYAVADGMGGHEAGEVASEIAIETLVQQAPPQADVQALGRAVRSSNDAVLRGVEDGRGKEGMGTTMTAAVVEGTSIAIAQVGDSRAYLLHSGVLQKITRDHSLVADLIDSGAITEDEARYHPKRSVITRALGSDENMTPDLYEFTASPGDRLLLCSDGLTGMLEDERIRQLLADCGTPQECADALIDAANDGGGHDNITAIIVEIGQASAKTDSATSKKTSKRTVLWVTLWLLAVAAIVALGYVAVSSYLMRNPSL